MINDVQIHRKSLISQEIEEHFGWKYLMKLTTIKFRVKQSQCIELVIEFHLNSVNKTVIEFDKNSEAIDSSGHRYGLVFDHKKSNADVFLRRSNRVEQKHKFNLLGVMVCFSNSIKHHNKVGVDTLQRQYCKST